MLKSKLILQKHNLKPSNIASLNFIYSEIAKRMISRLDYIKLNPQVILDIGSGLGIDTGLLKARFPKADILQLDLAINVLKYSRPARGLFKKLFQRQDPYICADALSLPIKSQSVDIVWSDLCLPYIEDMEAYFKEIRRVLTLGGYFLVTGLGVDSLEQLRDVGLQTYNFPDMHIIGDILVKLGFSHPVTDLEYITLEYDDYKQLLADIRVAGCGSAISPHKPLSRKDYAALADRFAAISQNGKIKLTLEVYYAHAWKDNIAIDLPDDKKVLQFHPKRK